MRVHYKTSHGVGMLSVSPKLSRVNFDSSWATLGRWAIGSLAYRGSIDSIGSIGSLGSIGSIGSSTTVIA